MNLYLLFPVYPYIANDQDVLITIMISPNARRTYCPMFSNATSSYMLPFYLMAVSKLDKVVRSSFLSGLICCTKFINVCLC
jgi:hypothetical protein